MSAMPRYGVDLRIILATLSVMLSGRMSSVEAVADAEQARNRISVWSKGLWPQAE
jgi:hypothetical protein